MRKTNFDNQLVDKVSDFLQKYMTTNNLSKLNADECADLLAKHKVLSNKIGPKPGFNFRQLLRDGRDGLIDLVKGASQERPRTKWEIKKIEK